MAAPIISIIVPVWDEADLTRACAASARAHTGVPFELIGIDNGSAPEAATVVRDLFDVSIRNETNLGFAAAMNQGLEHASGEFVVFLNNDTELPPGWAPPLLEGASRTSVGIVVPAVTAAGNQYSVRSAPGPTVTVIEPFTQIPSGVAYVMRRDTAAGLGGWSDDYEVASGEDLDLLFTVWANGLSVLLDERVLIRHHSAATAERLPNRTRLWRGNRARFVAKWRSPSPSAIPRLPGVPDEVFAANLDKAAVAVSWMERWFAAKDELHDLLHPPAD